MTLCRPGTLHPSDLSQENPKCWENKATQKLLNHWGLNIFYVFFWVVETVEPWDFWAFPAADGLPPPVERATFSTHLWSRCQGPGGDHRWPWILPSIAVRTNKQVYHIGVYIHTHIYIQRICIYIYIYIPNSRACWVSISRVGAGSRGLAAFKIRNGTLEPWNPGTLEPGTLEPWNPGTLEPWNLGTPEAWNPGTLEPRNPATLKPWNLGTLRNLSTLEPSRILEPCNLGTLEPWTLEPCNTWNPATPGTLLGSWNPETLEPWTLAGTLEPWTL